MAEGYDFSSFEALQEMNGLHARLLEEEEGDLYYGSNLAHDGPTAKPQHLLTHGHFSYREANATGRPGGQECYNSNA